MEISIKKTVEETKHIELPLFFKSENGNEYIGIFSEADFRMLTSWPSVGNTQVFKAGSVSYWLKYAEDWLNPEKFTPISEQDFINEWDSTLRSLSFQTESIHL